MNIFHVKKLIFPALFAFLLTTDALAGQYYIGHEQVTFTDPNRNDRPIPTEIYYPVEHENEGREIAGGNFPLLVFGHGFVMAWSAYENLWSEFVPQGYIMAFPRTEGGLSPSHEDFGLDLAFVAEAMQTLHNDPESVFYQALNGQAAAMGHSMGGGAAFLASGASNAFNALVGLAPAETSPSAIEAAGQITIPTLILSGSSDDVTPEATHQMPMYQALASESKTFVRILGGGHCFFANFNFNCNLGESTTAGNITISREEQQQTTYDFVMPWLSYFLTSECEAWESLQDSLNLSQRIESFQSSIVQKPHIYFEEEVLASSAASSFQWTLYGQPIEGATEQILIPFRGGDYRVEVGYYTDCTYISDPLFFSRPGDANIDGIVDVNDVIAIIDHFTGGNPDPFCEINADADQNGTIDVLDVITVINYYIAKIK